MPLLYIAHCMACGERFGANHYGARCQSCGSDVIIDFRGEYPPAGLPGEESQGHGDIDTTLSLRRAL